MKLFKIILLFCLLNLSPIFAKTITIGATPNPFASLLEKVKDDFKDKGYELKIIEFSDYILPNRALEEKNLTQIYISTNPFRRIQCSKRHKFNPNNACCHRTSRNL